MDLDSDFKVSSASDLGEQHHFQRFFRFDWEKILY